MDDRPLVLIVEKNPRVRDFLARELAGEAFCALLARDQDQAALLVAQHGRPKALVCDIESLSGTCGGWAAALCPNTPVVAMAYPVPGPDEMPVCASALVEKNGDPRPLVLTLREVLHLDQNGSGKKADSSPGETGPEGSQARD